MLFNSFVFALFLPIVFSLYWLLGESTRWQNRLILVASYVFYGWWDWRFLILMTISILSAWGSGELFRHTDNLKARKTILVSALMVNFGILFAFKYFNFFIGSLSTLFAAIGFSIDSPSLKIVLPVGISFYTFQAVGYVIDVYRRDVEPTRDPVAFMAFISFFPQLVAGPIERASNLLPQFLRPRKFEYESAVDGCRQMLWGFFKKMVVADECGHVVNRIFEGYETFPGSMRFLGAIFFAFQIYCDFSGYSDIAIGCARLFGFNLMRNFANPYFSRNISEFWRNWHISLMTWFRDYLYIPLGGNRHGKAKTMRNTFVVFAVSGLWHGANWTFIVWGLMHACLFLPRLAMGSRHSKTESSIGDGRKIPAPIEWLQMTWTFICVTLIWIVFRAPTVKDAVRYASGIFSGSLLQAPEFSLTMIYALSFIVIVVIMEWISRSKPHPLCFKSYSTDRRPMAHCLRFCIYLVVAILCLAHMARNSEFIYFQF